MYIQVVGRKCAMFAPMFPIVIFTARLQDYE